MSRISQLSQRSALVLTVLTLALAASAWAADRQRIEKEADIPRFSYKIVEPLETVVRDKATFMRVTQPVRADMESILSRYDIADKSSQRQFLGSLAQLDFLAGNYDAALAGAQALRELEDKPADKLLSGLRLRAMVTAARQTGGVNTPAYFEVVSRTIRQELDAMPFDVIANDVKNLKAGAELVGEGRIFGGVREVLQATLDKTGALSSDFTPALISARYALETVLPLKQTLIDTYKSYLNQHQVEKPDIWAARDVRLPKTGPYKTVNVAVWDSGVDTRLFARQVVRDEKQQPALIAFDLSYRPTTGELLPIPVPAKSWPSAAQRPTRPMSTSSSATRCGWST